MSPLHARRSLRGNTGARCVTIGGDPVRHGLVESISRPGRHVTGILFNPNVLGAKRVELLREIAPDVSRIALLMNPSNPNFKIEEEDAEAGAKKLGLETVTLTARNASEMKTALQQLLSVVGCRVKTGSPWRIGKPTRLVLR